MGERIRRCFRGRGSAPSRELVAEGVREREGEGEGGWDGEGVDSVRCLRL